MITREEALRRLDAVAHELVALRAALAAGWTETPSENPTQAFLAKCGGWEDTRSPEEIITEMASPKNPRNFVRERVMQVRDECSLSSTSYHNDLMRRCL